MNSSEEIKRAELTRMDKRTGVWAVMAHFVSIVFNPLLMPVYTILVLLYGNTVMAVVPSNVKFYFAGLIVVSTLVIPAVAIALLKVFGYVQELSLVNRRDRTLPLLITIICYMLCLLLLRGYDSVFLVRKFLLGGASCVMVALVVTYFWKISVHMLAAGGSLAMLLLLNFTGLGSFMGIVIGVILLCGALASARLYLGAHTPMQVVAGFFVGLLVAGVALVYL